MVYLKIFNVSITKCSTYLKNDHRAFIAWLTYFEKKCVQTFLPGILQILACILRKIQHIYITFTVYLENYLTTSLKNVQCVFKKYMPCILEILNVHLTSVQHVSGKCLGVYPKNVQCIFEKMPCVF